MKTKPKNFRYAQNKPRFKCQKNLQKDEGKRGETAFRYAFRNRDDAAKILHLTIMAFDIPRPAE